MKKGSDTKKRTPQGSTSTRQGTAEKTQSRTDSHSFISCGKIENKILQYMKNLDGKRFSIRGFSIKNHFGRTTIYDSINRLISKGMLNRSGPGQYEMTDKARSYMKAKSEVFGAVRRGCRGRENLSQHYTRYEFPIIDRKKFSSDNIKGLNPNKLKENRLVNFTQYYAFFDDATVIINQRKMIIRIHDVTAEHTEETMIECFDKAISYREKFMSIGIKTDTMVLEKGHWARMETVLADMFEKVKERFFMDLGNGRKLWIDYSGGKKDLESNDPEVLDRLYDYMESAVNSQSLPADLDEIKEILGVMVRIQAKDFLIKMRSKESIQVQEPSYIG